jgi:hypothetical protein
MGVHPKDEVLFCLFYDQQILTEGESRRTTWELENHPWLLKIVFQSFIIIIDILAK